MAGIPDELMRRLHDATQRFHEARMRAEGGLGKVSREQRDVHASTLRAAEKELEDVTREINTFLPPVDTTVTDASSPPHPG
jgi:hypothetical protein